MDWCIEQLATKDIDFMVETDMKDTLYTNLPSQHCAFVKGTYTELGPNQLGSQIANPKWIELIEDKGGEVRYNTTALTLVQDETGKVTGVTVLNKDGTYSQLNASKGVVVSTGGFSGNPDMMDVLGVVDHQYAANTMGCGGRMGDGIRMCVNAGAKMDADCAGGIMLFDRGAVALDHHVGKPYGESLTDVFWAGSQPWLKVNTLGERFCNEDGPYDFESAGRLLVPDLRQQLLGRCQQVPYNDLQSRCRLPGIPELRGSSKPLSRHQRRRFPQGLHAAGT